jgi:uncharacterized lipoprotein YehR (DUF1307 family)
VAEPLPLRNSKGATQYYLIGASQKEAAKKIFEDIFKKYKGR